MEFPAYWFASITFCLATGYHWKKLLYHLLTHTDIHADKISLTCLKTKQPQPSQPLLIGQTLQFLNNLPSNFLDLLQHVRVSLVLRSPEQDTVLQVCSHYHWADREWSPPSICCGHPICLGIFATLLAHTQLAHQDKVLLCKAAFQPFGLRLYWCMRLSFPTSWTSNFLLLNFVRSISPDRQCPSGTAFWHISQSVRFHIVCKPSKGTLYPITQVINKDGTQYRPQYWLQYWLLVPAQWSLMTCLEVNFVPLIQPFRPTHSIFNLLCCPLIWPVFNQLFFEDVTEMASKALIKLR